MSNIVNIAVDLWQFTDPADGNLPSEDLLLPGEAAHVATLRHAWQRRQWSFRRSQLKQVLAAYTDVPAREIALQHHASGKPYLTQGPHFSVSHSRGQTIVAICRTQPVGVDIEYLNADMAPSVSDFLSDFVTGLTIPSPGLVSDILKNWTRIEAICKASGRGLAGTALDLHPASEADVVTERLADATHIDWRVVTVPIGNDIICSIAADSFAGAVNAIDLSWRDHPQSASCAA